VNPTDSPARIVGAVLCLVMIELTVATAYIHVSLGGTIFQLNGIGYLVLAAGVAAAALPIPLVQRLGWVPRIGLAGYAFATIVAYLVIGPYFLLGWTTKAIEVAIIGLVVADLVNTYGRSGGSARVHVAPPTGPWPTPQRSPRRRPA
jgi:hypothetical protein